MDYVVLHFGLARILPRLQKGFLIKTAQFLLSPFGARPVVVRHLPARAARGDEVSAARGSSVLPKHSHGSAAAVCPA